MKILSISSSNPNYLARVFRVENIVKHPNADKLQIVTIEGEKVVTGSDVKVGDLYVLFTIESQIDSRYLAWSNSYSDSERNHDTKIKGYFPKTGRVKIVTLRGVPSNGYIVPASSIQNFIKEFYGQDWNPESDAGVSFDTICGEVFVKKYERRECRGTPSNPKVKGAKNMKKYESRLVENQFRFHVDTINFRKDLGKLSPDDEIVIAEKIHGCLDRDTILNTLEFGDLSIGDIVDNRIECKVLAFDLNSGKIIFSQITDWANNGDSDDWYEIEMENGIKIIATGNHPFFLKELLCYREVSSLRVGDEVMLSG